MNTTPQPFWVQSAHRPSTQWVLSLDSPEKDWSVYIKWDGCFEITRYFNGATSGSVPEDSDDIDTIHICDIDDFIARLTELRDRAKVHFENP